MGCDEPEPDSRESDDDQDDDQEEQENFIEECEECIVKGKSMSLNQFFRYVNKFET